MSATETRWQELAQSTLEEAGLRKGGARTAVIGLLGKQECAMTAREIDRALEGKGHGVGRASVYRALEQLEELGLVQRLDVGQGFAMYEPLVPGGEHHHHMVCDSCGKLIPFEDGSLERSIERVSKRVDFKVQGHDVALHGKCADCR